MANPLARVMMDQMSKKSGKLTGNNHSRIVETKRNLDQQEEAMISGVIHRNQKRSDAANTSMPRAFQGRKVQLGDLVSNTSHKESMNTEKPLEKRKNKTEPKEEQPVKNPYKKAAVTSSVVANPGKGVSAVSLKSLGKGHPL